MRDWHLLGDELIRKKRMRNNPTIDELYFEWMSELVFSNADERRAHNTLLRSLHDTNFYYILPMDSNRYEDGIDLRYRFGYEKHIEQRIIAGTLDIHECSVLEMMAALALRCEEHFLASVEPNDGLSEIFKYMLKSLGLLDMTNDIYCESEFEAIISRFLDRKYDSNGNGGLFRIDNCREDLTKIQIWYQMCWYLNTILE